MVGDILRVSYNITIFTPKLGLCWLSFTLTYDSVNFTPSLLHITFWFFKFHEKNTFALICVLAYSTCFLYDLNFVSFHLVGLLRRFIQFFFLFMLLSNSTFKQWCLLYTNSFSHIFCLRGYCTLDQFCDCLCIFLNNYNTLVTSKMCFL